MDRELFKLPDSLKGKVFRAEEFFKRKAKTPGPSFLLENLSNMRRVETPEGSFLHRRVSVPMKEGRSAEGYIFPARHPDLPFPPEFLSLLSGDPEWEPGASPRLVFLDLETTGLAGGTGTYPFLCGIGYFEGEAFVVEQFFMEDYPSEGIMLAQLAEKLKDAKALVTFNGKTFDVPLLATRFIYNRMPVNLELPHIDLLHPSRRIWRGSFSDCRLETIEREFFHLGREKDVDSSLIPQIYFHYVRGQRRDWMPPVFDHNVQDIVTLGALLSVFCGLLADPGGVHLKRPLELWGLGRLFLKFGWMENALQSLQQALYLSREPDLTDTLLSHMGRLYKKLGKWEEAIQAWERLLEASHAHRMDSAIELAKYYEHRAREPHRAREIILRVVKGVEITTELDSYISGLGGGLEPEITPELEKRLRRLERKIERKRGRGRKEDPA